MTHDIELVRHPRARSARLSVDPATGRVRLTIPRRASQRAALAWADTQRHWIDAQRARLPEPHPFEPGTALSVDGEALVIDWCEDHLRRPVRKADRLVVGGPRDRLSHRVEAWLKTEARTLLERESRDFALRIDACVGQVAVGDPRSRWGSCSTSGTIRYSWRLILAPPWVRRATVAHEVAHRIHMNHGPAFHALVAEILGADPKPARDWLRVHGAGLHWFGRSA